MLRRCLFCNSVACIKLAGELLTSIDSSVDTCTSLYDYTCGNFHRIHPLKSSKLKSAQLDIIGNSNAKEILKLLEEADLPTDTRAFKYAKTLYRQCMDTTTLNKIGVKPLLEWIDKFGGWPMISQAPNATDDIAQIWENLYVELHQTIDILPFVFYSDVDSDNSSNIVLMLTYSEQFLQKDIFNTKNKLNQEKLRHYRAYMMNVAQYLAEASNKNISRKILKRDVKDVMKLTSKIAKVMPSIIDFSSMLKSIHASSIEHFQADFDQISLNNSFLKINWLRLINKIYEPAHININKTEPIKVYSTDFIKKIFSIMDKESPKTIINYLMWTFVSKVVQYTDTKLYNISNNYTDLFYGTTNGNEERAKLCLKSKDNFAEAIAYAYIQKYFNDESKNKVEIMIDNIKHSLENLIKNNTWMDKTTQIESIKKLKKINALVGYPSYFSKKYIDENFNMATSLGNVFFDNMLIVNKFISTKLLKKLKEKIDREKWLVDPLVANSFYDPYFNTIIITAGIMKYPYFHKDFPDSINYGALGLVIGHELSHAFDVVGRLFDYNGNVVQWWSNETTDNYNKQTSCFIKRYSKPFFIRNSNITLMIGANLTLGENLADSTGLIATFLAFQNKKIKESIPDIRLPGLEHLSDYQLFFTSFANSWCSIMQTEHASFLLPTQTHSPDNVRVDVSSSNFPTYAELFNCTLNSKMNPVDKCHLW
ncbi:neprilysin-like isoform X2 [Prorops nasuta]|uniref:neprilysin-like isoform X2 n=1 Tax=Prorops nasuta TaxID=863751 RepID=UPI0034CDEA5F